MENNYSVYQHVTPDGFYYFGQTNNIKRRWSSNGARYKGTSLYPYIEKFGWDNIKHIVLFRDQTRENALWIENFLIETAQEDGVCINQQRSGLISKEEGYKQDYDKKYYEENKDKKKQYYETNKDKILEQKNQYREKNKDKIKQYYEDNKDKIKQTSKQYYETNKDKIREYQREYREQNKDKKREYNRQYYQRKKLEKQLKEVETTLF